MLVLILLTKENMSENTLDNFDRTQNVQRVYRKINNEYKLAEDEWVMDWSLDKKRAVAKSLINEDHITFGAIENGNIVGFASMEKNMQGEYIVLDMMHVSKNYRGQGIGKRLFQQAKEKAKEIGAKQLYISAFSSEDTVGFYLSMGCKVTDNPIAQIVEDEPFDVQMVCDID